MGQKILDCFVVDLQVGHFCPIGGSLAAGALDLPEEGAADARDQAAVRDVLRLANVAVAFAAGTATRHGSRLCTIKGLFSVHTPLL